MPHSAATDHSRFLYSGHRIDEQSGTLVFDYAFAGGPTFTETIRYGVPFPAMDLPVRAAFEHLVAMLYAVSGVSYYKLYAPHMLDLGGLPLGSADLAFLHTIFADGLGEFAYRNRLDLAQRLNFANPGPAPALPSPVADDGAAGRSAVLIGGGKDSLVSVEVLRHAGLDFDLLAVNPRAPMENCAKAAGKPLLRVERNLSPTLFALNGTPGTYNGHVPITAIVSLIAVIGCFAHGYRNVVLSNERSADEANIRSADGQEVNHQFSKTSRFEHDFRAFLDRLGGRHIRYFSLLRPLSEVHIARIFARTAIYDAVFTSCNKAFRLTDRPERLWCGDCAKCRFTFLLMAMPMGPERLLRIFGSNLLDNPAQFEGFHALTGLKSHKPWDCVGEEREAITLFSLLARDPFWQDTAVVRRMAGELAGFTAQADAALADLLTPRWGNNLPPVFEQALRSYVE